jgi:hypothetical protein
MNRWSLADFALIKGDGDVQMGKNFICMCSNVTTHAH